MSIVNHANFVLSFELFPPKTVAGLERLQEQIIELNKVNPNYFSVTYGAGGSTRERTVATVEWLYNQGINVAPHISCIGSQFQEIREILMLYKNLGINRLVALRGDLPSGMGRGEVENLRYANELVAFIRAETGQHFHIEVAAYPEVHPQAISAAMDLQHFVFKIKAGANSAITQYFYNADAYFAFLSACSKLGVEVPIIPGIMPITNYLQLARFSDTCGAEIPRWIRKRLEVYQNNPEALQAFGHEVVVELCRKLLDGGAPGLHFYTMNQAVPVLRIWEALEV